jgi:cytochrome oxidase Cu insertion factor (SCO1/SenC/PrrC family)
MLDESARSGLVTRRRAILVVLAALLAGVVVGAIGVRSSTAELPGIARDPAPVVEDLVFVDHRDLDTPREIGLVAPPGEVILLYLGYLSCPDVCPMTMVDIARALDQVGPAVAERATVAFASVDPERDDAERIHAYLAHFFGDQRIMPLTPPSPDALADAAGVLGASYEVAPHEPGAERYEVSHSAITYVIDDQGRVVRELPFGVSSEDMAQVLRALL